MAVDAWPTGLPDRLNTSSFGKGLGDGRLRSDMDTGPAKIRRRSSAMPAPLAGTLRMTSAQTITADAFVQATLQNGSLPFRFPHPLTRSMILVRFVDLPSVTCMGGDWYDYSMSLEVLP